MSAATFVLPGDVDDDAVPSGGNVYDRRTCQALAGAGRPVRRIALPGAWPQPDTADRARLDRALAGLPDDTVVIVDGLVACGVPDEIAAHAGRLRLGALVHLPLADETGLAPSPANDLDALERRTLHAVDAVVATSPWAARHLVVHHELPESLVHVVPPGTDPAPIATGGDGRPRLLCVASVTPRKGQELLVEALGRVADVPWTCELVGPLCRHPGYVERVRELIDRRGLGHRIHLTGPRTGRELAGSYAAADLVVLPSQAETFGMVVTEALAHGLPVLATAVDAVPETLGLAPDGTVPGMLVPPGDAGALADAVLRWSTDPWLRERLRASAILRRGTLQGWDTTALAWSYVLDELERQPRRAA